MSCSFGENIYYTRMATSTSTLPARSLGTNRLALVVGTIHLLLGGGAPGKGSGHAAGPPARSRAAAEVITLRLPTGGKIVFYGQEKPIIEVHCPNKKHGACVLTRRIGPTMRGQPLASGRPLGYAAAFSMEHCCATKEEHFSFAPGQLQRAAARYLYRETFGEVWRQLESRERDKRDGEESEPEGIP